MLISSSWDQTVCLWDASVVDETPSKELEAEMQRERAAGGEEEVMC